jgi:predicted homoserine dehydrogenase-like protein
VIIVDRALEERERTGERIRVGMIGAGFMARGIALQIFQSTPGMELVAIANRTVERAAAAFADAGAGKVEEVGDGAELDRAIESKRPAITADPAVVAAAEHVDAVVEVTGAVEFGARAVTQAIEHGKHVILMNAELDGTVGPALKRRADQAGVVYTVSDGDQPGVTMNLYRSVRGLGVRPLLCGNVKGLHDPYRNPTTQEAFAQRWGQNPYMVTSFADGTKISFEQAIVANATRMRVARRGMHGPTVESGTHVRDAVSLFPSEDLLEGAGIVDYVVGAEPAPGVFVVGTHDDPRQRHYLSLYKLGEGPFYCFYTPYHLCHFEVPTSVARAVLFGDTTLAPADRLHVEVVAAAKKDLAAGEAIDGLGGYTTYGLAENAETAQHEGLLPIGLAEGARLTRAVSQDQALTYKDVELPPDRLCDQLRAEQAALAAP